MSQPLNVKRNNYFENKKNSRVFTPKVISDFLFSIVHGKLSNGIIIDPCCGECSLLKPFIKEKYITFGFDTIKTTFQESSNFVFKHCDFLKEKHEPILEVGLIICNPPFNNMDYKRKLLPELFIKKIFESYGEDVPVILFAPMGFALNQRITSKRWRYFRDECNAEITGRIPLPLNIFNNVEFHNEILLWNLPQLKGHYWLEGI